MGTYGISIYGLAKYGTEARVSFEVAPFTVTPLDYSSVLLQWTSPEGSWDALRVLRNPYGWAINENDGEVLLHTTEPVSSYTHIGVTGGQWLYYTIFVLSDGQWSRAGVASTLMPKDHGYTDLMYDLIPQYYKVDVVSNNAVTDDSNVVNPYIRPFLSIFGFGFDTLKTYLDSRRYTLDAMRTYFPNIEQMATQFGIQYEASTPAHLVRQRVRDAARLGRQKGTLEQIRSVISQTTGYDVLITIGSNLMLSDDQADFDHPSFPQWDPSVNYAEGERVAFGSYLYEANPGGAYGPSQAPTGTASSNTYWSVISYGTDTTLVDENGAVAGWEQVSFTVGATPGNDAVLVGVGVQNPTDPDDRAGNALWVRNTTNGGGTATLGVRSVSKRAGETSLDPQQPVLYGIPLPYVDKQWQPDVEYNPGDLVLYHGRVYQAITYSTNVAPPETVTSNAQWRPLGYDGRVQMCLSGFTQAYSGQQVEVYPYIEYYDDHGKLITALYSDNVPSYTVLDTFRAGWDVWDGRSTDVGGLTWTEVIGQWESGSYSGGCAYPLGLGPAIATLPGHADGTVSATFVTDSATNLLQSVIFRYQDIGNYWRACRDNLQLIYAGMPYAVWGYSQACQDGDRITVSFTGSNIRVYRNGVQVLSVTDSTLSSATGVGLAVT